MREAVARGPQVRSDRLDHAVVALLRTMRDRGLLARGQSRNPSQNPAPDRRRSPSLDQDRSPSRGQNPDRSPRQAQNPDQDQNPGQDRSLDPGEHHPELII